MSDMDGSAQHSHPCHSTHSSHHPGAHIIQGSGKTTQHIGGGGGRERGGPPTRHPLHQASTSFQSPSAQPPTLSQAPSIIEPVRSHQHSSMHATATAGKQHLNAHHPYNPPHVHSSRPGSVNPSFRRDPPPTTSSSMLRSMSAEDLRRRGGGPPHSHHERHSFEREPHIDKAHNLDHHNISQQPTAGLILHQISPGGVPHYTSAGGFTRLPPSVMSVTPVSMEHVKGAKGVDESSKHAIEIRAYYEKERMLPPHEHEKLMRVEQERMLQMRERALERASRSGPPPGDRVLHEAQLPLSHPGVVSSDPWNLYRCKMCGQSFNQKHALEKHHCVVTEATVPKPYECGRCELSFHNPHDLQEHMVMHNSDRPFRCGHCARAFQSSSALKSHMRMHENMNSSATFPPKEHGGGKGVS